MKLETEKQVRFAVIATTLASIFLSLIVTYLVLGDASFSFGAIPAIIVPLIVAPLASYFCFSQARTIHSLNKELTCLVNHDTLTQAYSRSYFFDEATNDNYAKNAVTLMIDADDFKQINDRFGHAVGDAALKHLSNLISDETRSSDVVGRLGGEEFGVYMPATDYHAAAVIAERIRKAAQENPLCFDGLEIQLTVSIGLAKRHQFEHINSVLRRADKALYQAKNTGKNKVCFDETPMPGVSFELPTQLAV